MVMYVFACKLDAPKRENNRMFIYKYPPRITFSLLKNATIIPITNVIICPPPNKGYGKLLISEADMIKVHNNKETIIITTPPFSLINSEIYVIR